MSEATKKRRWRPSRRQFLIGLGAGAAVLAVGAPIGLREMRLGISKFFLESGGPPTPRLPESPFVWFEIDVDNRARLFIPKIEMGQGIHTTLAQIAADELELDWETVIVEQADTAHGFAPGVLFTFGSTSTQSLFRPMREVAATMRQMIRAEAAAQWNRPVDDVVAENSLVYLLSDPNQQMTYGQVIAGKQGEWEVPEDAPPLKSTAEFRYIGQSVPRVDFPEKLTGRAVYGYDVRRPNMLYGAVARPPRYGATLQSAAVGTADQQPGVVQVVIEDGFAGIVAESRSQAYAALAHLDLTWEGGTTVSQADIEATVTVPEGGGVLIQREGDAGANLNAGTVVTADYRVPLAAHAHLEPQAALVEILPDGIMVYASTQTPQVAQDYIAAALGVEAASITIVPTYLGGGFGRKSGHDVAVEAARLARAAGRPVHVGWNRTEDLRYGYVRPPSHNVLRGTLDADGQILAMEHQLASSDVFFYLDGVLPGGEFTEWLLGVDPLAAYGSLILYNIPHRRVLFHRTPIDVPTSFWRSLGSFANIFALESFMDEMAAAAGADPLEFRLRHLPEGDLGQRFRTALLAVAESSDWDTPPPAGRARGLAACYDRGTVVTQVAEVSVEDDRVRVHRFTCAVDPGLVVNPDGARAQIEGSIIMALSSTFYEALQVENGLIAAENFNTYPLLAMRDAPAIEVIPINSADEPVGGLGEPALGPVPAAVANALFALTGQRLRHLPLTLV